MTRTFPYVCHTVVKPVKPAPAFFAVMGALALMVVHTAIALNHPADEPLRRLYLFSWSIVWGCAVVNTPFLLGFRSVLPNRVVNGRGATWVLPKLFPFDLVVWTIGGVSLLAGGIIYIEVGGGLRAMVEAGPRFFVVGPVMACMGVAVILILAWQQLRGMKLTPEGITYWRGLGTISLAWDDLGDVATSNDVRGHEQHRRYADRYLPGAKVVVPVESVMGVLLRVHWEDENTPRVLLETEYFRVESSALLTAILALRDHPELRLLLGTRESKVLFMGPPWRVRRHMYRTQQWWPAGAVPEGVAVDSDGVVKESQ